LDSISEENKYGTEKGAVISMHPERLDPSTRKEKTHIEHYTEGGEKVNGMPVKFDEFAIKEKNVRSLDGWISITAHVHPVHDQNGNIYNDKDPSLGDFNNAPNNNLDAIVTRRSIILYDGRGTYNKRDFIRCEIDRATGESRKIEK
jgi:hypothetical protein